MNVTKKKRQIPMWCSKLIGRKLAIILRNFMVFPRYCNLGSKISHKCSIEWINYWSSKNLSKVITLDVYL